MRGDVRIAISVKMTENMIDHMSEFLRKCPTPCPQKVQHTKKINTLMLSYQNAGNLHTQVRRPLEKALYNKVLIQSDSP